MLTISLDRLSDLLDQAAEVDLVLADDDDAPSTGGDQIAVERVVDDAAYQGLLQSLKALSPDERYELLALGLLGRSDAAPDDWGATLERARATSDTDMIDELASIMLFTDEIEMALDRLGIGTDAADEELEQDDEEETEQ